MRGLKSRGGQRAGRKAQRTQHDAERSTWMNWGEKLKGNKGERMPQGTAGPTVRVWLAFRNRRCGSLLVVKAQQERRSAPAPASTTLSCRARRLTWPGCRGQRPAARRCAAGATARLAPAAARSRPGSRSCTRRLPGAEAAPPPSSTRWGPPGLQDAQRVKRAQGAARRAHLPLILRPHLLPTMEWLANLKAICAHARGGCLTGISTLFPRAWAAGRATTPPPLPPGG